MNKEFNLKIITTNSKIVDSRVSEIVLPAFDGEVGILAGHENFVGLLGTGVLKIVEKGDDYWFMVSSGLFEVDDNQVTVLTEIAEPAKNIDIEGLNDQLQQLSARLSQVSSFSPSL